MGSIETKKNMFPELTVNIAKGEFISDELLNWVRKYYSETVTKFILWDFTQADLSNIATKEFDKIADKVKEGSDLRAGGKTAFVVNRDIEFGLGRMFEALSKIRGIQFEYKTFRNMTEAKKWLDV